ncbi:hypothetical protein ACFXHA_39105 [Nocardia sp. NPDC059240]|uniref:hypothetical protein n=1 Tax=Nocardia sp. NPDC059240 TaxID=3346786 RepID=UPI00367A4D7D
MTDAEAGASIAALRLDGYQQGDVLDNLTQLGVLTPEGWRSIDAPHGVVLISQTCDIAQTSRSYVQVASLAELAGDNAGLARKGKRPRYAYLPELGTTWFADLEVVATVDKLVIADLAPKRGVVTDADIRKFGNAVARKFGRFAFPDEVVPWLSKLERIAYDGSGKPNSPLGRALEDVLELRIEAISGWDKPPFDLRLLVVVEPGVVPIFEDDEYPDLPAELGRWLDADPGSIRTHKQIAERLYSTNDPVERYFLWHALGGAWAAMCQPSDDAAIVVHSAVMGGALGSDVVAADELTYDRYRRTELLDVDHLC